MEALEAAGRDIFSFLLSSKGIPVLLLLGLLVYVRKYLAAAFCLACVAYIVGLMSMGRLMNVYDFPLTMFLGFIGAGLLLVGWLGYMLFIRQPAPRESRAPGRESTIFREGPPTIFFDKHGSSVFMGKL